MGSTPRIVESARRGGEQVPVLISTGEKELQVSSLLQREAADSSSVVGRSLPAEGLERMDARVGLHSRC